MKRTVWYHGGRRIADWSQLRWDRKRHQSNLNAEGPGMYWTTDFEEASGYAEKGEFGVVYEGVMRPGFRYFPKTRPVMSALERLYEHAPEESQATFLSNWSVDHPPKLTELINVLGKYRPQDSLFDAFVTLYHDLYQYDADAYVSALQAMGFDGHILEKGATGGSRRRRHLVLWNPRAMEIR